MARPLVWAVAGTVSLAGLLLVPGALAEHDATPCSSVPSPYAYGYQLYVYHPRPGSTQVWLESNALDGLQPRSCRGEDGATVPPDTLVRRLDPQDADEDACADLENVAGLISFLDWANCPQLLEFVDEAEGGAGAGSTAVQDAAGIAAASATSFAGALQGSLGDAVDGLPEDTLTYAGVMAAAAGDATGAAGASATAISGAATDLAGTVADRAVEAAGDTAGHAGDLVDDLAGAPDEAPDTLEAFEAMMEEEADGVLGDMIDAASAAGGVIGAEALALPGAAGGLPTAAQSGAEDVLRGTASDDDHVVDAIVRDFDPFREALQGALKTVRERLLDLLPFP